MTNLNCKPGDLAVIVGSLPAGAFLIGRFVEVLEAADDVPEGAAWWVRIRPIVNPLTGEHGGEGVAADCFLRPIRDPGDSAQDQTLAWLPVPSTTKETA